MRTRFAEFCAAVVAACVMGASPANALPLLNLDNLQLKLYVTQVNPDEELHSVSPAIPGAGVHVSNHTVPTVAIDYFVTPHISVETICCVTEHDVNGSGALAGVRLARHVGIVPATVTALYHFNPGGIDPYVGAGASYFFFYNADAGDLGRVDLDNSAGWTLQAGVNIPIRNHWAASIDVKKVFLSTTAHFRDAGVRADVRLDPWVVSAGVAYRF